MQLGIGDLNRDASGWIISFFKVTNEPHYERESSRNGVSLAILSAGVALVLQRGMPLVLSRADNDLIRIAPATTGGHAGREHTYCPW